MYQNRLDKFSFDAAFIDKADVFIEANSPRWRAPMKISVQELFAEMLLFPQKSYDIINDIDGDTIIVDPSTLRIKINPIYINTSNVFCESFNNHNISYCQPPINSSSILSMHMATDGNYLYIWVGNRWKRALLTEW